jgi:hypothetical protein
MQPHALIEGHEKVLERFGQWPSFHDGEVHRLLLDSTRRDLKGSRYPSVEIDLRGWIMTNEVTEQGFYRCEFDSVVRFLFEKVSCVELDGLNHQNVLSCLGLELLPAENGQVQLKVVLEHCYGLSGVFVATSAKILSVTPYVASSAA